MSFESIEDRDPNEKDVELEPVSVTLKLFFAWIIRWFK